MRKGQKHTEESRIKIQLGHKGQVSIWKGKKLSEAHRKALSESHKRRGDRPPSRRGTVPWNYEGKTVLQEQKRKCFEYRQWRSDVFQRDDYICQRCVKKGLVVNADHIKRFAVILAEYKIKTLAEALLCNELWNINNGRTLCEKCHRSRKTWDL